MKIAKNIFAALFLATLLGFSFYNLYVGWNGIGSSFHESDKPKELSEMKEFTAQIDTMLVDNLAFGHWWNETYAIVYNILGKNEENSFKYVRDKYGKLYAGNFWNTSPITARENAKRIRRLSEHSGKNTKVIVLFFPDQYNVNWSAGYYGMPYANHSKYSEEFLRWLRYYNIDYIDYGAYFEEKGYTATEIFFKTDHHWTPQRAFEGFQILVEHLNDKYGAGLESYYTDLEHYNTEQYAEVFIGSQGRDAGIQYSGLDDYTIIIPKFETEYYYESATSAGIAYMHGTMDETLITRQYLMRRDYYIKDMYCTYLQGICNYDMITNLKREDGLNVLYIRDSFASPLATFFSSYCYQTDMMWAVRTKPEDMEEKVEGVDYDYIFIAVAPETLTTEALSFYPSVEEEEAVNE